MAWLYVPGLEVSNEDLNQELMDSKPFVTSRGKPMQSRTLLKRWRTVKYFRLLSGLTFKPSTAQYGVVKWILSLEDSHVSPIQLLGSYLEKKTQETYGRTLKESLAKYHHRSFSWKTFQTSIIQWAPKSLETWPKWGLTVRGVLYELPTLEPPIEGPDGSYSLLPTPTASDGIRTNLTYGAGNLTLKGHVVKYPTPTTSEAEKAGFYSKGQMGNSLVAQAKREGLKNGGRLNPQWVEWLMGWPIGWTDLEDWGTE